MTIQITDELVESVLPNTLITVDEESSISSRIEPYVKDSLRWLESRVIGDITLPPALEEMAVRTAVLRAVMKAVPSLDLVVTPTGFGVVSSEGLVPASKERIERLISSLADNLYDMVLLLQESCILCREWRESTVGRTYCSTFIPRLSDVSTIGRKENLFEVYGKARHIATELEAKLAEDFIGMPFMENFRSGYIEGDYDAAHPVVSAIRHGVMITIARHIKDESFHCPNDHEVWHVAESILRIIRHDPALSLIWESTMGKKIHVEPFKNTRKGGYFF